MNRTRKLAAAALGLLVTSGAAAQALDKVRFGFAQNAVSPIVINFIVPSFLGYYKEEGLEVEMVTLGTNAAVMASLDQKRVEFGVGVPSFQLPLAAKGEKVPGVNYYEYTYPFKWAVAVTPDSAVKSLTDLKGRTVGVSSLGVTDYPIGKALLRQVGLDPGKDVQWLAVGEGVTAGQALQRGAIAGLVYFDTGFGTIEGAGMKMRYLALPAEVPKVGGLYISATRETLDKRRRAAIGLARGVAKASFFIQNNPEAAAYIFIKMYPEAAPRGVPLAAQIKRVVIPIAKRAPLYSPLDKSITEIGRTTAAEWADELEFLDLKGKVKDPAALYTNELIAEINKFDRAKVIAEAKAFRIPAQ